MFVVHILHLSHAFLVTAPAFGQMFLLHMFFKEWQCCRGQYTQLPQITSSTPFLSAPGPSPDLLCTTSLGHTSSLHSFSLESPLQSSVNLLLSLGVSYNFWDFENILFTFGIFVYSSKVTLLSFFICFKVNCN